MKKIKHILEIVVEKYLSDKPSLEEDKLLEDFTASYTRDLEWDEATMGVKQEVSKQILDAIKSKVGKKKTIRLHPVLKYTAAVAACVVMIVTITMFNSVGARKVSLVTTEQQMDSIQMSDGTIIYLSPYSSLSYTSDFNKEIRETTLLKGNAFFKVAKNPNKPFIINSGEIKTKVLGTSFNIELNDQSCTVKVATGKVQVMSVTDQVDLTPNQAVSFSNVDKKLTKRNDVEIVSTDWYKKDITLNNASIEEIMEVLAYKFGSVTISQKPALLATRATIFIAPKDSLHTIIDQINYVTNLKLSIHENRIRIEE